jgi:hypothetical protein
MIFNKPPSSILPHLRSHGNHQFLKSIGVNKIIVFDLEGPVISTGGSKSNKKITIRPISIGAVCYDLRRDKFTVFGSTISGPILDDYPEHIRQIYSNYRQMLETQGADVEPIINTLAKYARREDTLVCGKGSTLEEMFINDVAVCRTEGVTLREKKQTQYWIKLFDLEDIGCPRFSDFTSNNRHHDPLIECTVFINYLLFSTADHHLYSDDQQYRCDARCILSSILRYRATGDYTKTTRRLTIPDTIFGKFTIPSITHIVI